MLIKMKRIKIELYAGFNIAIGLLFYWYILGNIFLYKKLLLSIFIVFNITCFLIHIKGFKEYKRTSYVTFMGYLSTLGFLVITLMLEILELTK